MEDQIRTDLSLKPINEAVPLQKSISLLKPNLYGMYFFLLTDQ